MSSYVKPAPPVISVDVAFVFSASVFKAQSLEKLRQNPTNRLAGCAPSIELAWENKTTTLFLESAYAEDQFEMVAKLPSLKCW
ncbi:hypothetical protein ACN22W_22260 [Burkholderia theae]|uniref:hypothetical protein n=1 Tax=Burkholderia theae TaxID=3143496 RepID=UPI003AFAC1FB